MSLSGSRRAARLRELRRRLTEQPELFEELFHRAVAALAEGELSFPPPFDLAASAALADNEHTGETAAALFEFIQKMTEIRYHVIVEAIVDDPVPGGAPMRREIVNCQVPAAIVAGLLIDVLGSLGR